MKIVAIATLLALTTPAFAAPATPAQTNKQSDASQDTRPAPYALLKRNQDPSGNRTQLPKTYQDPYGVQRQDPYGVQRPLQSTPHPAGKSGPQIG